MRIIAVFLFGVLLYASGTTQLLSLLSDTVHSVQFEREIACKYNIKDNVTETQLKNVFESTDIQIKKLKRLTENIKLPEKSKMTLTLAIKKLDSLNKFRNDIISHKVTCHELFNKYNDIINTLFSSISTLNNSDNLKSSFYQYTLLLLYEEAVWEKKLEITAYLKLNNFNQIKDYFVQSSTKEKIYFQILNNILDNEIRTMWKKYIKTPEFRDVNSYEEEIMKKIDDSKYDVSIKNYNEKIYGKIKILREIEAKLLEYIKKLSKNSSIYTDKELEFINRQIPIRYVFDPSWKPFEYKDEIGQHRGIIADIIKIIKLKTNLNFVPVPVDSWSEAKEYVKDAKADMFSAITENEKRKKFLNFTKHTIYSYSAVLIGRKSDTAEYKNMRDFKGKLIGIKKGYVLIPYLKKKYPYLHLVEFKSLKDGLNSLQKGKIDFFVNNIVIANYYINKLGYSDLKVAKKLDYTFKLKIAIRKDKPKIILDIIDKALATIPKEEINEIYYKWTSEGDKELSINKKQLSLKDILPIKELLIIGIVLFLGIYAMLKYFGRKKDVAFGYTVFVFVSFFLVSIVLITLISIKNLEKIKKSELAYSLQTILTTTHESIRKILLSQENYLNILLSKGSADELKKLKNLKFVNGYIVMDSNYHITKTTFNISEITNRNFLKGLEKAKKFGFSVVFPVKNSPEALQKIFFIKTVYNNFKPIKYIAVGIDKNIIQSVLDKGRMGHTGETYLINGRKEMVSQSRFDSELRKLGLIKKGENSFLNIKVDTLASRDALKKHSGINTEGYPDYRKIPVYGAWAWDNDYNIAIISEIDKKEAMQSFYNTRSTIYYALFAVVAFVIVLMVFIVWLSNKNRKALEKKNKELEKFNTQLETLVAQRTKSLEDAKHEIELIHKHTKDSIEFASLLQDALIPDEKEVREYFDDFFVIWHPKDIVGGDIWLFEKINENECILMVIDCTGHGVPGAFVTMLVKAIEREIVAKYKEHGDMEISPAYILGHFNKTIKKLLKQENEESLSNAGFDGGVLYYNKQSRLVRYSSARIPLFMVNDEEISIIKGDRYSVGYKKNDKDYSYSEYEFVIEKETELYITTDGYLDQIGGEKCLPFGKKKFKELIKKIKDKPMDEQRKIFESTLHSYERMCEESERLDDITLVGIKIRGKND